MDVISGVLWAAWCVRYALRVHWYKFCVGDSAKQWYDGIGTVLICAGEYKGDNTLVVRKKKRQSLVAIGMSIQQK